MMYRYHDLKRLQREQGRSSSSISSSSSSSSSSLHAFLPESSKQECGKCDEKKIQNPTPQKPQKPQRPPKVCKSPPKATASQRLSTICEKWGTELDEKTQTCLEYSLPMTLPALSWLLKYSCHGVWFCIITVLLHTLESALTNFGPQTGSLRFQSAPLSPVTHMLLDCVIVLSHSLAYALFPHHFGKHPYIISVCFLCTLPYYVASSYKTHICKIRREKDAPQVEDGENHENACKKHPNDDATAIPVATGSPCDVTIISKAVSGRANRITHLLRRRRHPSATSLHLEKDEGPITFQG